MNRIEEIRDAINEILPRYGPFKKWVKAVETRLDNDEEMIVNLLEECDQLFPIGFSETATAGVEVAMDRCFDRITLPVNRNLVTPNRYQYAPAKKWYDLLKRERKTRRISDNQVLLRISKECHRMFDQSHKVIIVMTEKSVPSILVRGDYAGMTVESTFEPNIETAFDNLREDFSYILTASLKMVTEDGLVAQMNQSINNG